MTVRLHMRVAAGLALGAVAILVACSGVTDPELPDGASFGLVVSEPLSVQSSAAARVDSDVAATGIQQEVAFVSLPPGSFPEGETATITNLTSEASRTARLVDGGFDPVSISAAVGDKLKTTISRDDRTVIMSMVSNVPLRLPPTVVRTEPEKGKVDVLLNVRPIVVFSEPIDRQTVTPETIKLLLDGQPIEGTLILSPDGLRAEFTPAALLALQTTYTLIIATGIQDLAGDLLEQEVVVSFTTQPLIASVTIVPNEVAVAVGAKIQLLATVRDALGNVLVGRQVGWSGSDDGIFTVDADGLVTGIAPGSGIITATSEGVSGTANVTVSLPGLFTQVSTADLHTCGITTTGEAYCWGHAVDGQLGIGPSVPGDQLTPAPVQGGLRFSTVSVGSLHTCGVTTGGDPYCWGWNFLGNLGDGDQTGSSKFVPVQLSLRVEFQSLSVGSHHSCGVASTGDAYCWGTDESGQLGRGGREHPDRGHSPVLVAGDLTFTFVSAGGGHTCSITTSGDAYCWGWGALGALGNGSKDNMPSPRRVEGGLTFGSVSSGGRHTCGITISGETYCWGNNDFGQLGTEAATLEATTPVRFSGALALAHVSAGGRHTCGITTDGETYCWGNNEFGQLGNNSTSNSATPVLVAGGLRFTSVSAGWGQTCGVTDSNEVYCWGHNHHGQLGDGSLADKRTPIRIAGEL